VAVESAASAAGLDERFASAFVWPLTPPATMRRSPSNTPQRAGAAQRKVAVRRAGCRFRLQPRERIERRLPRRVGRPLDRLKRWSRTWGPFFAAAVLCRLGVAGNCAPTIDRTRVRQGALRSSSDLAPPGERRDQGRVRSSMTCHLWREPQVANN
jgi:hypothetical protein